MIVAPAVLAERERLRQEASEGPFRDAALGEGTKHVAGGDKTDGGQGEGKGEQVQTRRSGGPSDSRAHHFESLSPEAVAPSIKKLQAGASSLLRFLVAVSMRQATPAAVYTPQEGVMRESARNGSPSRVEGRRQVAREHGKRSTPSTQTPVVGDGGTAAGVSVASSIPPTRERSMYGTPFQHMQTHVDSLHQVQFEVYFVMRRGMK